MRAMVAVLVAAVLAAGVWSCAPAADEQELVVYTSRKGHLIKPVFDAYTEETGVSIRYITDQADALINRLQVEGKRTPADLLITSDAGNLWRAADLGLLQPVDSVVLNANVPDHLADPGHRWFGLTVRARTLVYAPDRVQPQALSSYADLADERWRGRLCLRTSKKVYNQSLVAGLIANRGKEDAEAVVKGWVENLATDVFSNDTAVIEAILAGQCDVGIVNTYYYGRLKQNNPQLPLALHWANQETTGTHINISGAGVTGQAKNRERAVAFLEWLSQPEAQRLLADENLEYPVNVAVSSAEQVQSWGDFKADDLTMSVLGEKRTEAVRLMEKAGWQ